MSNVIERTNEMFEIKRTALLCRIVQYFLAKTRAVLIAQNGGDRKRVKYLVIIMIIMFSF